MRAYLDMWKRIKDYEGRTSRKEYWTAFLVSCFFSILVVIALSIITIAAIWYIDNQVVLFVMYIMFVAYFASLNFAWIAMSVRRLKDSGTNRFLVLIWFFPVIGWLLMLMLLCQPSVYRAS